MLGNHADAFFTTPMRTRVYAGGNVGNQSAMPAPREVNQSATRSLIKRGNFLPLNGQMLPGLSGDGPALAGQELCGLDLSSPMVWVGLAGLAYVGMKLLKK